MSCCRGPLPCIRIGSSNIMEPCSEAWATAAVCVHNISSTQLYMHAQLRQILTFAHTLCIEGDSQGGGNPPD